MNWRELEPKIIKAVIEQRPADACEIVKQALDQQKQAIIEKIESAKVERRGGLFNGDTPVVFCDDVRILDVFKKELIKHIKEE